MSRKLKGKKKRGSADFGRHFWLLASISGGLIPAVCLAFIPLDWWPAGSADLASSRDKILGLFAANMTLATIVFAVGDAENPWKTLAYLATGFVTLMAATFALEIESLTSAAFVMLTPFPLLIAIAGPLIPIVTRKNGPAYCLIFGLTLMVLALIVSMNESVTLAVVAFFVGMFGQEVGLEIAWLITSFVGIIGVLLLLAAIAIGAVQLAGLKAHR